jgi:hypothetical protein
LKEGESCKVRFRGLYFEPAETHNEAELTGMPGKRLIAHAKSLGCSPKTLKYDQDAKRMVPIKPKRSDWVEAVLQRYTQIEPFFFIEHYVRRLKGPDAYMVCADDWGATHGSCVACAEISNGNRGISVSGRGIVSLIPRRKYHYIERKGKKEFSYCAKPNICRLCDAGDEPRQESLSTWTLASTHISSLLACNERVSAKCGNCKGMGSISVVGLKCPSCGDDIDVDPTLGRQRCPSCREKIVPHETLECSNCDDPRRAQLFDTDVVVQRIGAGTRTSYQFVEQYPFEPLPRELMNFRLPDLEEVTKPDSVAEQCRKLGLLTNPITGEKVSAAPRRPAAVDYDDYDDEIGDIDLPDLELSDEVPF